MATFDAIGVCVFDAYGTLLDVNAPVRRLKQKIGGKADAVAETWRTRQVEYTWLRSLMHAHADFWQVTQDALDYALAAHGVEADGLRDELLALYRKLEAYPDAQPLLAKLKGAGLQTAILSNGSPDMLESAAEASGLAHVLDAVISVEEVGVFKPDPRVYQLAVDRFSVERGDICFVSSNAWDVAGASHFGFRVAHCNRFGQPPERLPGKPDAVVASLEELGGLLG